MGSGWSAIGAASFSKSAALYRGGVAVVETDRDAQAVAARAHRVGDVEADPFEAGHPGLGPGMAGPADVQRGIAHFVEHMAFNGTRRFPKAAIVNFLERAGMAFGADVNAATSFDETVYMLEIPTDRPGYVDKGMTVLQDFAAGISFIPEEVEKERGVVLEEWRGRQTFTFISLALLPVALTMTLAWKTREAILASVFRQTGQ